jgi:hypothetical protein
MADVSPDLAVVSTGRTSEGLYSRLASGCWPWLLAAVACVLALLRTGYAFDISNNTFHIPIVLRFADMTQFMDDSFVLSLQQFFSSIYPLLSLARISQTMSVHRGSESAKVLLRQRL